MSKTPIVTTPLPFDELAEAIKGRRSVYGQISGLQLDRAAPGEAWSSLPYRPVFVGDTDNRRAARRRRHRHARRELRHGGPARARRCARDRNARPAHRLPEARNARPRHQGAFGLLPRHPLDRLRALDRLPGIRGRSRRHRHGLLHDRRQPDQHAPDRPMRGARAADAGSAGGSGRREPVRAKPVRALCSASASARTARW